MTVGVIMTSPICSMTATFEEEIVVPHKIKFECKECEVKWNGVKAVEECFLCGTEKVCLVP